MTESGDDTYEDDDAAIHPGHFRMRHRAVDPYLKSSSLIH